MSVLSYKTRSASLLPPLLSGGALKWIALITMFFDHVGAVLLENGVVYAYNHQLPGAFSYQTSLFLSRIDPALRFIGRISFPLFCFLLVEGFFHTSSRKRYALRLLAFALLSELPFDLCFGYGLWDPHYQNVLFTLLFGFLTIWGMEKLRELRPSLFWLPACAGLLAGWGFQADYNWKGILLILVLYLFYRYPLEKTIGGCLSLLWEAPACLAFIPINLYNGKKGKGPKYFFYLFYPLHLLLLFVVRYGVLGI